MITAKRYFSEVKPSHEKEAKFFAGIRLKNKTFKTTSKGRMSDLDAIATGLANDRGWRSPSILDVGIASGITTLDLQKAMNSGGITPSIVATDVNIRASIVTVAPGIRLLIDAFGDPLQYDFYGLAVRPWNSRFDYISGYWILSKIGRTFVKKVEGLPRKEVLLLSRHVTSENSLIETVEDDLEIPNANFRSRFDIVRAANILNLGYFGTDKLKSMAGNLKSYARGPGALIILNRTHLDGTNHGSVFEVLSDHGLRVLRRVGSGSEIESLMG